MSKHNISRRKFINQSSCAAIASTTLLSSLFNLKMLNAAAMDNSTIIAGGDYKALVCILKAGGNDSFNMLIPSDTSGYNTYKNTRTNLAIDKNELLQLNGVNFGLHPSMPEIRNLFNSGKLSFVSNVGTLIEPIKDKFELQDGTVKAPIDLFSHQDQSQQWQTSIPNDKKSIGWGGKMSDLLMDLNDNDRISMNISLAGTNVFQRGNDTIEYSIDPQYGSLEIDGYQFPNLAGQLRTDMIDNMLDAAYLDKFQKAYVDVVKFSKDVTQEFNEALDLSSPVTTVFSDSDLSRALKTVANIIAARTNLGMKRQIFFIEASGWDHHDYVLEMHSNQLEMVSKAMEEFNAAMEELNISDCVTTFTMSEFGRTLTSNGDGSDHAWGGNVMAMGGPVNGGQIFGDFPNLEENSDIDIGGGVLVPSLSVDEYFAELALWFGVSKTELTTLFPNIGNFYNTASAELPIGFLNV